MPRPPTLKATGTKDASANTEIQQSVDPTEPPYPESPTFIEPQEPPPGRRVGGFIGNEGAEIRGIVAWINTELLSLAELRGKVVLVDFWATWCGPCKILSPILDELSEEYKDKVEFYKIDVDQNKAIAESYGVMGIPSIKIFKNGEIIEELTGLQQKEVRSDILERTLKA